MLYVPSPQEQFRAWLDRTYPTMSSRKRLAAECLVLLVMWCIATVFFTFAIEYAWMAMSYGIDGFLYCIDCLSMMYGIMINGAFEILAMFLDDIRTMLASPVITFNPNLRCTHPNYTHAYDVLSYFVAIHDHLLTSDTKIVTGVLSFKGSGHHSVKIATISANTEWVDVRPSSLLQQFDTSLGYVAVFSCLCIVLTVCIYVSYYSVRNNDRIINLKHEIAMLKCQNDHLTGELRVANNKLVSDERAPPPPPPTTTT